jgi:hypothetical protein
MSVRSMKIEAFCLQVVLWPGHRRGSVSLLGGVAPPVWERLGFGRDFLEE